MVVNKSHLLATMVQVSLGSTKSIYLSICWRDDDAATGDDPPPPVEVHVGQGEQVGRSRFPAVEAVFKVAILQNSTFSNWDLLKQANVK